MEDMFEVMFEVNDGVDLEEVVKKWIKNNLEKVVKWMDGVEKVDGDEIKLIYVVWDFEIVFINVVVEVLK